MKELSIEDKAKRYDEAIEKAKYYYDEGKTLEYANDIVSDIFPELKESDDEMIRKEIIDYIKHIEGQTISIEQYDSWIAWLEKQGTPAKLSEEEQNRFAKGVLTSCALSFIDYLDAHKYEGKMCVSNGECEDIENAFHNAMWDRLHRYYCKYIEKQGEKGINGKNREIPFSEQKPAISDNALREGIAHFGITQYQIDNWLKKYVDVEKQGEQKPNPCENCGIATNNCQKFPCTIRDGEQKPAWSEEDEKYLIYNIEQDYRDKLNNNPSESLRPYYNKVISLLKSIRHQKQWKPSEEQMMYLSEAIDVVTRAEKFSIVTALEALREQLKKLREG